MGLEPTTYGLKVRSSANRARGPSIANVLRLAKTLVHHWSTFSIVGQPCRDFPGLHADAATKHSPLPGLPAQGMVTDVRARYMVVARLQAPSMSLVTVPPDALSRLWRSDVRHALGLRTRSSAMAAAARAGAQRLRGAVSTVMTIFPIGGQEFSPLVDVISPRWRT